MGEYDKRNETDCVYYRYRKPDCADKVKEYRIESFVAHPDFDVDEATNDIGLIKLADDVEYSGTC